MELIIENITKYVQSGDEFPVDFEAFWQWCGYARKDNAKRILEKNFTQLTDYQFFRRIAENSRRGRPVETIKLTVECAKAFAMLAQTDKGREIRKYFIECEEEYNARISPAQMLLRQAQQMVDFENRQNEQEERIRIIEEDRQKVAAELEALGKEESLALFVDSRKALDQLVKNYATYKQVPVQKIYKVLYRQFSLVYGKNLYQNAKRVNKTPIAWLESRGWIPEVYELAKRIFVMPTEDS